MQEPNTKFLTYQNPEGNINIHVRFEGVDVWLTMPQIVELLGTNESTFFLLIQESIEGNCILDNVSGHDFRTIVDKDNNSKTNYYSLFVFNTVRYSIDYHKASHFIYWLSQELGKIRTEIQDDLKSKSPKFNSFENISRLGAKEEAPIPKTNLEKFDEIRSHCELPQWLRLEIEKVMLLKRSEEAIRKRKENEIHLKAEEALRKKKEDDLKKPPLGSSLN